MDGLQNKDPSVRASELPGDSATQRLSDPTSNGPIQTTKERKPCRAGRAGVLGLAFRVGWTGGVWLLGAVFGRVWLGLGWDRRRRPRHSFQTFPGWTAHTHLHPPAPTCTHLHPPAPTRTHTPPTRRWAAHGLPGAQAWPWCVDLGGVALDGTTHPPALQSRHPGPSLSACKHQSRSRGVSLLFPFGPSTDRKRRRRPAYPPPSPFQGCGQPSPLTPSQLRKTTPPHHDQRSVCE